MIFRQPVEIERKQRIRPGEPGNYAPPTGGRFKPDGTPEDKVRLTIGYREADGSVNNDGTAAVVEFHVVLWAPDARGLDVGDELVMSLEPIAGQNEGGTVDDGETRAGGPS